MKSLIIYQSVHHQNTEKIAKVIAKILKARLVKPDEIKPEEISNYDLIGFGSGIYFGQYHRSLIDFAKKLPTMKGKKTFVFSTSGRSESILFNLFSKIFKKILLDKGLEIIGQFNCLGFDTFGLLKFFGGTNKGRPNEKDLALAQSFSRDLLKRFSL